MRGMVSYRLDATLFCRHFCCSFSLITLYMSAVKERSSSGGGESLLGFVDYIVWEVSY